MILAHMWQSDADLVTVICEAGWHFDGSRYGKNGQNVGYSGLLTEKSFQNK